MRLFEHGRALIVLLGLVALAAWPGTVSGADPGADAADARASSSQAPRCFGEQATIVGERGQRVVRGTPGDDVIVARQPGRVRILARRGDDKICAGRGADVIDGGPGFNLINGGPGRDICRRAALARRCAPAKERPSVRFGSPAPQAVVDGGVALHATEEGGATVRSMLFEYSHDGGQTYTRIDRVFGPRSAPFVWETGDLPAGDYRVRVTSNVTGGGSSRAVRALTLNTAPVAQASFQCTTDNTVVLNGLASFDPDEDAIVEYAWDFGDGSPQVRGPEAGIVEHTYEEGGEYFPQLQVTDVHGALGNVHLGFDLDLCDQRQKTCDPLSMDVTDAGDASWDMHWIVAAADKKKLGAYTTLDPAEWENYADNTRFQFVHNFEVVTQLVANSDPALCAEGQRVRRTANVGGVEQVKRGARSGATAAAALPGGAAVDCPFVEPEEGTWHWCDDRYRTGTAILSLDNAVAGGRNKYYIGQSAIRWLDGPGHDGVTKAQLARGGFSYKAYFEAEVIGETTTVQCAWQIDIVITVNRNGPNVGGQGLHGKDCG